MHWEIPFWLYEICDMCWTWFTSEGGGLGGLADIRMPSGQTVICMIYGLDEMLQQIVIGCLNDWNIETCTAGRSGRTRDLSWLTSQTVIWRHKVTSTMRRSV